LAIVGVHKVIPERLVTVGDLAAVTSMPVGYELLLQLLQLLALLLLPLALLLALQLLLCSLQEQIEDLLTSLCQRYVCD
jgi:hypothetical protein